MSPALWIDFGSIRHLDSLSESYCYPHPQRFIEAYDTDTHASWLARRNVGGIARPLAIQLHTPILQGDRGGSYLESLSQEMALQAAALGETAPVSQLLWSGCNNCLTYGQIKEGYDALRRRFALRPVGDYAIALNAPDTTSQFIGSLPGIGFNTVQLTIDAAPTGRSARNIDERGDEGLSELTAAARDAGFRSIQIDLRYGTPGHTIAAFEHALARAVAAQPDRISLHASTKRAERRARAPQDFVGPEARLQVLALSERTLVREGFQHIGLEHFAKNEDVLAQVQRQGQLHLTTLGYSQQADSDVVAMGSGAIASLAGAYSQNFHGIAAYRHSVAHNRLPIARGLELSVDDLLRRAVMAALMCHSIAWKESFAAPYLIDFDEYFAAELEELRALEAGGLVELHPDSIALTPAGKLVMRNICAVFDRYRRSNQERRALGRIL